MAEKQLVGEGQRRVVITDPTHCNHANHIDSLVKMNELAVRKGKGGRGKSGRGRGRGVGERRQEK